ncbi:unnamed protein product [Adineta steineri]|uniref:G-protein coupled receptors family 1 profile domain-containing protein n=1 Tax=Adineta steineri TaxID=433720 RepID=A0A819MGU6_9BILA|nr:unnamed protein product [Adineta steineri]CAF3980587.1 unnamed protein product [Adineta steineri]
MSNVSNTNLAETLDLISIQFNRYFSIFIFLFGTIGNLLNCLVLSRPSLRSNPCTFYFLISSIANIISIIFGLTSRILSGWHMDLTNTNAILCKFRAFIMLVSRSIAFWLIAFATIDRWLSSCIEYQRRQYSSLKNAQQGTIYVVILSSISYFQVLYCYDANMSLAPLRCYGKTIMCRLVTDLTYALVTILCPLLVMFIFGLLTISNIRQMHSMTSSQSKLIDVNENNKKTLKSTNPLRGRRKRIDRYLRHVLFVQIIFLTMLTIPQVIEKLYTTLTMNQMKSSLNLSIEEFIYNFVLLLTYLASGMPFYIYTLSGGNTFRNALMNLFRIDYRHTLLRTDLKLKAIENTSK